MIQKNNILKNICVISLPLFSLGKGYKLIFSNLTFTLPKVSKKLQCFSRRHWKKVLNKNGV